MWKRADGWVLVAMLAMASAGCATPPGGTPTGMHPLARASQPPCTPCAEQMREIARLREDAASREAEVRELRSDQRLHVKVLQESKREASRARVKLRRLATRADAASYIAEVEVAVDSLRSSLRARSTAGEWVAAERVLESTATPFAEGDYGLAIDRAAEAERLIALAAEREPRRRSSAPATAPPVLRATRASKTSVAGKLRGKTLGMARARTG
jgi:hypothetical protein